MTRLFLFEDLNWEYDLESVFKNSSGVKTVAVFGAGIAGLTVAHELSRLGYKVSVFEALPQAGGFFRSARLEKNKNIPSEYSWHGFGPWYHNAFSIMKQIPFSDEGSVYDLALSRPIDFGIFPDQGEAKFYDHGVKSIPQMFKMTKWDFVKWSWLMLKTWCSRRRSIEKYARLNGADEWARLLSNTALKSWRSCFGPWIGSDWSKVSLHTVGEFFRKQLMTKPLYVHSSDQEGSRWYQGAGDGWLLLRGPSSEYWFDRWLQYLKGLEVKFHWNTSLVRFNFNKDKIDSAQMEDGSQVLADVYVLAINPFSASKVIEQSPGLGADEELAKFKRLVQDGPHTQVSFRIAFGEEIFFPRKRTAVVVSDSEYNITLFAEEQVWDKSVELGKEVKSLWTGTSCIGGFPGRIFHLPVENCTKEQYIEEIKTQIFSCGALESMIKEANNDRSLRDFKIISFEIWHEWNFSKDGIRPLQKKWVTTTNTQAFMPNQKTSIPNLFLAGAHTKTAADVWSIEGAVESGRRAAKDIDNRVQIEPQYIPNWLNVIRTLDDLSYKHGLPHILSIFLLWLLLGLVVVFF